MSTDPFIDLKGWYIEQVQPLLREFDLARCAQLDRQLERLGRTRERLRDEVAICFVGESGVGKSTLVNALVAGAEQVLPAGGIGPLTAQAISVGYADRPSFVVEYQSIAQLNKTIFTLSGIHSRSVGRSTDLSADEATRAKLTVEELGEIDADSKEILGADSDDARRRRDLLVRQARLLVRGNQDADLNLGYLIDCLRAAMGHPAQFGHEPQPEDVERVTRLRQALDLARSERPWTCKGESGDADFRRELTNHAAGFLSPMISRIDVRWPSPLLVKGLVLVDLPGVGIANDAYQGVTAEWVRAKASAIVLVLHRGVTTATAKLLAATGFFNRLLHSADDLESDPAVLLVAVTRVDDVAESLYMGDHARSRRKVDHLAGVMHEAVTRIGQQLWQHLADLGESSDSATEDARQGVLSRLRDTLEIYPVTAPEYARLLRNDDDDRSFIREPGQSGVPQMAAALEGVARRWRDRLQQQADQAAQQFGDAVCNALLLARQRFLDPGVAEGVLEHLRQELGKHLEPFRFRLAAKRGAFQQWLTSTRSDGVTRHVERATEAAEKDIERYLATLGGAHWMTLRAAVRRGGAYDGATTIHLPREFVAKVEAPVATGWSREVLGPTRRETRGLASDLVAVLTTAAEWATARPDAQARVDRVAAERDQFEATAEELAAVGEELVEDARAAVRTQLHRAIEKPIQQACEVFVQDGDDVGVGVKGRILALFSQLARHVRDAVRPPFIELLAQRFDLVEQEIRERFSHLPDPFERALEAIAPTDEWDMARQQRTRNADSLTMALELAPPQVRGEGRAP